MPIADLRLYKITLASVEWTRNEQDHMKLTGGGSNQGRNVGGFKQEEKKGKANRVESYPESHNDRYWLNIQGEREGGQGLKSPGI